MARMCEKPRLPDAMRILIFSHHSPPHTTPGALRVGKTAKYLRAAGHTVRVIAADDPSRVAGGDEAVPAEGVTMTRWLQVNQLPERFAGGKAAVGEILHSGPVSGRQRWLRLLGELYRATTNLPDSAVGWLPFALGAGAKIIREWHPNVLLASAPPYTACVAASLLARRYGIPWVADMRDPWADYHGARFPAWRKAIDRRLERLVLDTAAHVTTATELFASEFRRAVATPVTVVTNGYDEEDYAVARPSRADARLEILYTGHAHAMKQDPTPLFEALGRIDGVEERIRVTFHGRRLGWLRTLVAQQGLERVVEVQEAVPHETCVRLQRRADILLFLVWRDPAGVGIVPAKLFDYAGARRPILAIGPATNLAAQQIIDRRLGPLLDEPTAIAAQLEAWLATLADEREIPDTPEERAVGMTRRAQTAILERVLHGVVGGA